MFATFTAWKFDGNVENASENAKKFWPQMKSVDAQEMCANPTGANSDSTMTNWNSKEECEAALDKIRAPASDAASMKVVGTAADELAISLHLCINWAISPAKKRCKYER